MPTSTPRKNRLSSEPSLYLQQHATNPVDWYPWGEEAFTKAKEQNKPIFLSIGYATCHWCHVMAQESFEDEEVAHLLNDTFICIKVDREERPDIDNLYMKACILLTGSGGWPLTIIMTPEKKPFFAATYIPKTPRFGMIGIIQLTAQIQTLWRTQKEQLFSSAEQITTLLTTAARQKTKQQKLDTRILDAAYERLLAAFDEHNGGFSTAPKFPTPHHLFFLLRYWKRTKNPYALTMVERTLEQMRLGGIFDQIGYGFHRYATDAQWNIPHFEKMLYDQALLLLACTEAYQATHHSLYKQIAREIATYILRDMTSFLGGFYAAEDADSDGEEGKYYTWTSEELQRILSSDDFDLFTTLFSIIKNTTARASIPTQPSHPQILFHQQSFKESATLLGLSDKQLTTKIKKITTALYQARKKRTPPLKDDKILCDWNGLMIAALAKAGVVFGEQSYVETAEKAAQFLEKTLIRKTGQVLHRFRDGTVGIQGFADDYAFLIWGFLELYQACFGIKYLCTALKLNRYFIDRFWDDEQNGFFFSESVDPVLPRTKEWYDGAMPTANSVSSMNLLRLSRLTGDTQFEEMAEDLLCSISDEVILSPTGYTALLTGLDFALGPSQELIVVGSNESEDTQAFLSEIRQKFLPSTVVVLLPPTINRSLYEEVFPFSAGYSPVGQKATVYVCMNQKCLRPVTEVQELRELLL
jgi:uncharacterized protein